MGRSWPALDVRTTDSELVLAWADDFAPTALEEHDSAVRLFFATPDARNAAYEALAPRFDVDTVDVSDEDWARRSQQNLAPVTVGRVTILPSAESRAPSAEHHSPMLVGPHPHSLSLGVSKTRASLGPQALATSHQPPLTIVIQPSMGFGTGHHATTRLCLAALQTVDLTGASLLDVGTGSGVLAIAAARLGAARALGIDTDVDAIHSARDNLALNPDLPQVAFDLADLTTATPPRADVVTANLTAALLVRGAATLADRLKPGGTLILSGLLAHERSEVLQAFSELALFWDHEEDGWVGLALRGGRKT